MSASPTTDEIATAVITAFEKLPKKNKPRTRDDGTTEWIPLAGIVLEDEDGKIECVALGTGMKALPSSKLPDANGCILHDSHAEVIAIRAFNRFLLSESSLPTSPYLLPTTPRRFNDSYKIHFYTSEAPCGDASMSLTIASQPDPTAWTAPTTAPTHLRGRGFFSHLGAVRTKPGRADSDETLSKSCSDKLAVRQCLSLVLGPTAGVISPEGVYITSLTMPESQYDAEGCVRAWGAAGRMKALEGGRWEGGYAFVPFVVRTTAVEFKYSRRSGGKVGCNVSAVWVKGVGGETLVGGVLQGRRVKDGVKAGCMVSRLKMCQAAGVVGRYAEVKAGMLERQKVKMEVREVLGSWVESPVDDFEVPAQE